MARIKEKSKENWGNTIWTWVVVGVLSAVVITGIVLSIIYFVNLNKGNDGEKTFEERYPNAENMTLEQLDKILNNEDSEFVPQGYSDATYVLIYTPDLNDKTDPELKDGTRLSAFIDTVVEAKPVHFFIVNILDEGNKDYVAENSVLTSIDKYPTLLMIGVDTNGFGVVVPEAFEDMNLSSGKVTDSKEISIILERIKNN